MKQQFSMIYNTTKNVISVQCGFIQVQVVSHLLLPGFKVTPLAVRVSRIVLQMKFIL